MKKNRLALALALSLSATTVCAVDMPAQAAAQDTCDELMGKCAEMKVQTEEVVSELTKMNDDLQSGERKAEDVYDEVKGTVNEYADSMEILKNEIQAKSIEVAGTEICLDFPSKYVEEYLSFWPSTQSRNLYDGLEENTFDGISFLDEYKEVKGNYEADPSQENYGKLVCKMAEFAERLKYDQWKGLNFRYKEPFDVTATYDVTTNVVTTEAHMNHKYLDLLKLNKEFVMEYVKFNKDIVRTYTVEGEDLASLRISQNEKQYSATNPRYDVDIPGKTMYTEGDSYVMLSEVPAEIVGEPVVNEDGTLTITTDGDPDVEGDEVTVNFFEYWSGTFEGSASVAEFDTFAEQISSKEAMKNVAKEYESIMQMYECESNVDAIADAHLKMFKDIKNENLRQPIIEQKARCEKMKNANEYAKLAKQMITYKYLTEGFNCSENKAEDLMFIYENPKLGVVAVKMCDTNDMKYYRYTKGDLDNMRVYEVPCCYASENNEVQYQLGGSRVYVNAGKNWHNVIGTPVMNEDGSITITYKEYLRLKKVTVNPTEQDYRYIDYKHAKVNDNTVFCYLAGGNTVTYIDKWGRSNECKIVSSKESRYYSVEANFLYKGQEIEAEFRGSCDFSDLPSDFTMKDIIK